MADRLKDKIAIATGAGTSGPGMGNGKAAALLFAREGATVVTVDLNEEAAAQTAKEIAAENGRAMSVGGDVSSSKDVQRIVDTAVERFGRIDVLHNNVGIEITGDPVSTTEEAWDRVHAVNLKSVFLFGKHVIPVMQRPGLTGPRISCHTPDMK
jgi:NAD(P)-dependent dehydrogenase (short-subunit alcohol dehydrogenase family)